MRLQAKNAFDFEICQIGQDATVCSETCDVSINTLADYCYGQNISSFFSSLRKGERERGAYYQGFVFSHGEGMTANTSKTMNHQLQKFTPLRIVSSVTEIQMYSLHYEEKENKGP